MDSPGDVNQTASTKDIFGDLSSEEDEDEDFKEPVEEEDEEEDEEEERKVSVNAEEKDAEEEKNDENTGEMHVKPFVAEHSDSEEEKEEPRTPQDVEMAPPRQELSFGDRGDDQEMGDQEEEEEEVVIPETRIDVEVPRIDVDLGKEIHFVKLPNFLSVETHPYDAAWYDEEGYDEDEGGFDDEGRLRIKLKVENTIRWRSVPDEDGNIKRESNARYVRWSDGSMSLYLGNEIFDMHKQNLMTGDNNHLFIRQGTGLQGQAVFRTKLTFRPHSTDSFTHRKMTMSLADRSQKDKKIRVLPTIGKDPEAHRSEMIKKEEDRLKASIRRENKSRRVRESANLRGPSASYLEPDDDDEGGQSISAIKNKYKKGGSDRMNDVYTDSDASQEDEREEEEYDSDDGFGKKADKKRKAKIEESSDEDD